MSQQKKWGKQLNYIMNKNCKWPFWVSRAIERMGSRRKILFFSQTRSSPSKLFATIDSDIGFSLHRNSPVGAAFALDSCPCRSKTQSYSGTLPNRRSKCAQPTRSGNTLPVIAGGSILPRVSRLLYPALSRHEIVRKGTKRVFSI